MKDVTISKLENKPALCLYTDDETNGEIFHFSDETACAVATEICEEICEYLAEGGYSDSDICEGNIGKTPCLFLFEGFMSNTAKVYVFKNERDLHTACEMAYRYLEMKDEDDEEDSGEDE